MLLPRSFCSLALDNVLEPNLIIFLKETKKTKKKKTGELCLSRANPEETLVEARSDSDVQIDRLGTGTSKSYYYM